MEKKALLITSNVFFFYNVFLHIPLLSYEKKLGLKKRQKRKCEASILTEGNCASIVRNDTNGTFDIGHSQNQLEKTPSFKILIVPGSELDHQESTNISDRYNCSRYIFSFKMANPDLDLLSMTLTITLSDGLTPSGDPECKVEWGDEQEDVIKIRGFSASKNHSYTEHGIYYVTGTCKDKVFPRNPISCPIQNRICVTTDSFFDEFFKKVSTPIKYLVTDPVVIKSHLRLSSSVCSSQPVITWRLAQVINDSFTQKVNIKQSGTSVLTIGAQLLDPGEYIVFLEVSHPGQGSSYWKDDFLLMYLALPELVPIIEGGHLRFLSHGASVYINASASTDPVTSLPAVTSLTLSTTWSLAHYNTKPTVTELELFQKDFPISPVLPTSPSPPDFYNITQKNDMLLKVDTRLFPLDSWVFVMFTMVCGERKSSTLQIINFVQNAVPVKISCVYNCNQGRERKFNYDRLEFDSVLPWSALNADFNYTWTMYMWQTQSLAWVEHPIITNTGITSPSVDILKSTLTEGTSYRIVLTVTHSNYAPTDVEIYGTVNILPYGGDCTMNTITGQAARTWFEFTCANWMGPDQRRSSSSSLDTNPILTFTANQYTYGAHVEEEPILLTRSLKSFLILKIGDPDDAYLTTIKVRATDIYNNYQEFKLQVTANPAFAWDSVTPDEAGRNIITSYTNIDYVQDTEELTAMGKVELLIPLVSSVCSHIHLINLPQWSPPLPRQLNANGAVVDLKPNKNTLVDGYSAVIEDAETVTYDLATLALMEVMQNMTNVISNSSQSFVENSTEENDKFLGSTLTNAFTNLAARSEYANEDMKKDLVYLSDLVGTRNMDYKDNVTVDESAQIEVASGEVYNMTQAIVKNVVPNDLRQFFNVNNLTSGRRQINDMLRVVGQNISTYDASMSPLERAQVYLTMQFLLATELDKQKQTAKDSAATALKLFKLVQDTLRVCSTCTNIGNNFTEQLIVKNFASIVKASKYETKTSKFQVDGLGDIIGTGNAEGRQTASVSAVEFDENVFMYDEDQKSSAVTSNVLHVDVKLSDSRVTPKSLSFNQSVVRPETSLYMPLVDEEDASEFSLHSFIYKYNTDFTCIITRPENDIGITLYTLYVRFRYAPTILEYDFVISVSKEDDWKVCIAPDLMDGYTGLVFVGVQVPRPVRHVRYSYTLVTLGCLTWEEGINKWHSDKCNMTWFESEDILSCSCDNLTDLTFANTFFVAPNRIDFSTVFLRFSPLNQVAILGAISGIFVLYVIVLMIVIPLDKKDVFKWGITPLRDNMFGDKHYYIIKVYTGMRKGAGTTSRVCFILSGDKGDTGPRELFDGLRQEFSTGSVRSFFMATTRHLGCLLHIFVWHDNSGKGNHSSWYLSRLEIFDIATKQTYTFIAERWVSADTELDIEIKGSQPDEPIHFDSQFLYKAREHLSESHLWISIIYRPQSSTFTRTQRASCALAYIFLAMIANAMYFNPEDNYESVPALQVGPFRFGISQIYVSIVCAMVTTPLVMLIVFLFKNSKPREVKETSHERSQLSRSGCCWCCRGYKKSHDDELHSLMLSRGIPDFKTGVSLPHWCIYLGWCLAIFGTLVSGFFLVLYSIEWGKQKSEEWLSTFLLSLVESILFIDPLVVVTISFFLACFVHKPANGLSNIDVDQVVENYQKMQGTNKENLDFCVHVLRSLVVEYHQNKYVPLAKCPPIKGEKLTEAADIYRHYKQVSSVVLDLVFNVLLMLVIFIICYNNRDSRSYRHHEYIENQIVDPNYVPTFTLSPRFHAIKSHGELFDWINQTVFPSLFSEVDLTGQTLHWTLRENMNGLTNYRLGPPRLRQLRTKRDLCDIPKYGEVTCYSQYSIGSEETTDSCIGWKGNPPCPLYMLRQNASLSAWKFISASEIWGIPTVGQYALYGGGGYLATFHVNLNNSITILNELFHERWLDRQTRAVMLEFTLYCAFTNIFIYSSFFVEFPETGGAVTSYVIYPMRLYNQVGTFGIITIVCEVLFVLYTIFLLVKLCVRFYQRGWAFFRGFWLVFDFGIFILAFCSIVLFVIRLTYSDLTIGNFKKDKKKFVNFSHIMIWDQLLISFLAFMVFMVTIRILEIFGQAKKVQAVNKIFQKCGRDLVSFGLTFCYLFLGFCFLGFLLFGSQLWSYMSVYRTVGTLFLAMLGVTKYAEMNDMDPILAKVFFILYIVCIIFFVLSIFLSILGGTIDEVVQETRKEKRQDILEYMMAGVKSVITRSNMEKRHPFKPLNKTVQPTQDKESFNRMTLPYMLSKGTSIGSSLTKLPRIKASD